MCKQHLDLWVDLMWHFRPSDADWAMVGPFFTPQIVNDVMRTYWANGVKYPVPWADVEKVFISFHMAVRICCSPGVFC